MVETQKPGCKVFGREQAEANRNDPERRAELIFYDELCRQLPAPWIFFYDVAWLAPAGTGNLKDGQTDFILVHPDKGILLVEVKGGGIRYDGGSDKWFTKNKAGEFEIDPINQVKDSKFALLDKLKSIPALRDVYIDIFHAVAFPDVQVPSQTPVDAPREILIGADELQYLTEKVEDIFRHWRKSGGSGATPKVVQHLTEMLSRSVEFPNPLVVQTDNEERQILRLTEEQYRILDTVNRNRRTAIGGCAGSGKTFLAVEKARRLEAEGYRVLLTCFNRVLADYLKTLAPKSERLDVFNWHGLCWHAAQKVGIELPLYERGSKNEGLDEKYGEALCDVMEKHPELRYDAVIVDEGQDFDYQWWITLEACLRDERGILYVFYDDNQTLYKGRGNLPANMTDIFLQENLRNAKPIFDMVSRYYSNDDGVTMVPRGPDGREIERFAYKNDEELRRQVERMLNRLVINEKIPAYDVVVLTPKRLDRSVLMQGQLPGPVKLVPSMADARKNDVVCSTIHSFKGLERRIVLMAELDEEFLSHAERDLNTRCYVGFSRAKSHLAVFAKEAVIEKLMG